MNNSKKMKIYIIKNFLTVLDKTFHQKEFKQYKMPLPIYLQMILLFLLKI